MAIVHTTPSFARPQRGRRSTFVHLKPGQIDTSIAHTDRLKTAVTIGVGSLSAAAAVLMAALMVVR